MKQTFKEKIQHLCTYTEEVQELSKISNLYLILGHEPGDDGVDKVIDDIDHRYLDYKNKLRGYHNGPYKIQNHGNSTFFCHGYILGVPEAALKEFEDVLFMSCLKHGYQYQKIINTQRQDFEKHFDSLFETITET